MEYDSAIKRNTVLMGWIKLEPIIKSEVSEKQKDKYCILTHLYGNQKKKMVLNNLVTGQQWKNRRRE